MKIQASQQRMMAYEQDLNLLNLEVQALEIKGIDTARDHNIDNPDALKELALGRQKTKNYINDTLKISKKKLSQVLNKKIVQIRDRLTDDNYEIYSYRKNTVRSDSLPKSMKKVKKNLNLDLHDATTSAEIRSKSSEIRV